MKILFAVTRTRGPSWDASKPMNAQEQWPDHAKFMNALAAEQFIILGGPIGESGDVFLVVDASDESEIRAALSRDPWSQSGLLDIKEIRRWTILLGAQKDE